MPVFPAASLSFDALPGRRSADPFGGTAEVGVRVVHLEAAPDRRPHRHPDSLEVIHVVAGRGRVREGDALTPVGPGDTVLIPAGVAHATLPDPGERMTLACFFPVADFTTEEL